MKYVRVSTGPGGLPLWKTRARSTVVAVMDSGAEYCGEVIRGRLPSRV
jgi:hypothetical protein